MVYVSEGSRGDWRGLRPPPWGGELDQASPNGLLPNNLAEVVQGPPPRRPPIEEHVDREARRLLETVPARSRAEPWPTVLTLLQPMPNVTLKEAEDAFRIGIQLFIRDISDDLITRPPARVASVMCVQVISFAHRGAQPAFWISGPHMSAETVVRADSAVWLFGKLDQGVRESLSWWTGAR